MELTNKALSKGLSAKAPDESALEAALATPVPAPVDRDAIRAEARPVSIFAKYQRPCRDMSRAELVAEDAELDALWKERTADDEGHGGSPGEWIVERSDEIATELKRRSAAKTEASR